MTPNQVVHALTVIRGVFSALAGSIGGAWNANLVPAIDIVFRRLVTPASVRSVYGAIRIRQAESGAYAERLDHDYRALARAVDEFTGAPRTELVLAAKNALRSGAALIESMERAPVEADLRVDLTAFRRALVAMAAQRSFTPAEQIAIVNLRGALSNDSTDAEIRDALFDLESR